MVGSKFEDDICSPTLNKRCPKATPLYVSVGGDPSSGGSDKYAYSPEMTDEDDTGGKIPYTHWKNAEYILVIVKTY